MSERTLLTLKLAGREEVQWAQRQVTEHHYLHKPIDVRCSILAYIVLLGKEPMGTLMFGRPEAQRCIGWYGSVEDVLQGRCRITRWQVLNLARVWLDPRIQKGGESYIQNAATFCIAQALQRVVHDYLVQRPPCFLDEPWEITECLSYCDTRIHQGTLYRAANFQLVRENKRGIQTYARPLRRLKQREKREVIQAAEESPRSRKYRSARVAREQWEQSELFEEVLSYADAAR